MKQKNPYVIAIDLDNTIVTGFDNYDAETFEYIKKISNENYIVISTGRPYRSSKYFYDKLGLKTPIVNYNGALVHHPYDSSFSKTMITVDKNDIIKFIEHNKDILVNIFCEIEDEIFVWQFNDFIEPYLHLDGGNLHVGDFKDTLYGNPNGAIVFSIKGSEANLECYFRKYAPHLRIRFWDCDECVICEVYNPATSKANALTKICEFYNVPLSNLIAIGDGHNDIEMLELAGLGVAMENGHPDLIKIANKVVPSVHKKGVLVFIKEFFRI